MGLLGADLVYGSKRTALYYLLYTQVTELTISNALVDLVSTFAKHECSELRDKVYALLPLSTQHDTFPVDYTSRLEELYFRLPWHETENDPPVYVIRQALKLSPTDLLSYASKTTNGRDTLVTFLSALSVYDCHPSPYLERQKLVRDATDQEPHRYFLCCACRIFSRAHFLLTTSQRPDTQRRWRIVGLVSNGDVLPPPLTPEFDFSWDKAVEITEIDDQKHNPPIRSKRMRVSVTRFAFAVLVDQAARLSEERGWCCRNELKLLRRNSAKDLAFEAIHPSKLLVESAEEAAWAIEPSDDDF